MPRKVTKITKIFFSHPLGTYNTPVEELCLVQLKRSYPNCRIIDPKYIQIAKSMETPEDFALMMVDFILPIVGSCHILAYYKDDNYAPGVDMEIAEAGKLGIPIIRLEV